MKTKRFDISVLSWLVLTVGLTTACMKTRRSPDSVTNSKSEVASAETPATANADKAPPAGHLVTCRNGNDVRVLHAEPRGSGCQMAYTKAGKRSVVANAATGLEHCENVLDKIRAKLESSNFACE